MMRDARDDTASVIEVGQGAGRLAIGGVDLHAGEPIEVEIADIGMVPARVEWDARMGWVAYVREARQSGEASVVVPLRPRLKARWGGGR